MDALPNCTLTAYNSLTRMLWSYDHCIQNKQKLSKEFPILLILSFNYHSSLFPLDPLYLLGSPQHALVVSLTPTPLRKWNTPSNYESRNSFWTVPNWGVLIASLRQRVTQGALCAFQGVKSCSLEVKWLSRSVWFCGCGLSRKICIQRVP